MKIRNCLKRFSALLFAGGMVFSSIQTPIHAESSSLQIDVSGNGSVLVTQNNETKEITGSVTLSGSPGEEISVSAQSAEGSFITSFAVFTDATSDGLSYGDKTSCSYTAALGSTRYIAIDFGNQTPARNRISLMAASAADYDKLQPGTTGSGTWFTDNTDMFATQFRISWIQGDLAPFADLIVGQYASCIDKDHIGVTNPNAYGITSLDYTYRVLSRDSSNITVYIESDYLRKANGQPATGWSAALGRNDTYQRFAITLTFQIPSKTITVNLNKESSNLELTSGNDCYSLEGAVYGVYSDAQCTTQIGTLTTDAAGHASIAIPNMSSSTTTVYVKEISPSKGYFLNEEVIPVPLDGNNAGTATSKEVPGNDPLRIYLNKVSEDGQYVSNPPSLEGAEFTVSFYNGQYPSLDSLPVSPTKSWVIQTIKNGSVYSATLDDAHFVSGDQFYYTQAGNVTLPLGTITVQETKAPEGYTLDGATYSVNGGTVNQTNGIALFNITETADGVFGMVGGNEYTVTETPIRSGSFSIKKLDSETGENHQGDTPGLSAKFKITNNNDYDVVLRDSNGSVLGSAAAHQDFDYIIQTDADGNWTSPDGFISYGSYTITEIEAPEGYKLSGSEPLSQSFTVNTDHQTLTLSGFKDDVMRGGFKVQKNDSETSTRPQGDTNLRISFNIVNLSASSVIVNGTAYAPGEIVFSGETNEAGYYESPTDMLPYGTYRLDETAAPDGYTSGGNTSFTFTIRTDGEVADLTAGQISNRVVLGNVQLHKTFNDGNGSSWSQNESGAVFAVVRKSFVDKYGSVEVAIAHQYGATLEEITDREWLNANIFIASNTSSNSNADGSDTSSMTAHEYSLMKTGADGYAVSGDLAYGEYIVKQLASGNDEVNILEESLTITIDSDGQTLSLQASNVPEEYYLRIVKKDADTGKIVTLNSAEFMIYQLADADGNPVNQYISQQIGSKDYYIFRTTSENGAAGLKEGTFYAANEAPGSTVTPLKLKAGTYQIQEITNPDGYLLAQPITVEIKKGNISETDNDGDNFITVTAEDDRIKGELSVHKTIEDIPADTDLLPENVLQQIEFTLTADADILDPADRSVLTKAGEPAKDIYGAEVGIFGLNQYGYALIKNLPIGEYTLTETGIPSGLAEISQKWHVSVAEDGDKEIIQIKEDISNTPTSAELSKKAVTGDDELLGAEMQLLDDEGNLIDSWTSGSSPHVIKGLNRGEEYTLVENASPDDEYAIATSITFTVNMDGSVNQVEMRNKQVLIDKVDADGESIEGAEITVYELDDEGNVVTETVTDSEGTEVQQPKVVDQWITEKDVTHAIRNLIVGRSYQMEETAAPEGYVKAASVQFTVEDNGEDQHISMTDKQVFIDKTDADGEELPGAHVQVIDETGTIVDEWVSGTDGAHPVSGLEVGKTYTWHEDYLEAVGYYYAEDYTFTVTDDGIDQHMTMVDHPIRYQIAKVDDNGDYVSGVTLKLTDVTDPDAPAAVALPDEGVTGDEPITLDKVLSPEHTYILEETDYVPGVYPAVSIQFTVPKFGTSDVTTISMLDVLTAISVQKVDNYGNPLPGAKLQILETATDEEGNVTVATDDDGNPIVVYEFTSTDEKAGVDVSEYLKGDQTYILHEAETPFGFNTAEDIIFTVKGTKETAQIISMTDVRKTYYVSAIKVDAQDQTKYLKGAEITLFRPDGSVATDVNGNQCIGITDGTGVITWHVEFNEDMENGGYYVQETKAPTGYRMNNNKYEVVLSEDYNFAADNAIRIVVNDEALPAVVTGVYSSPAAWITAFFAALAGIFFIFLKKKAS